MRTMLILATLLVLTACDTLIADRIIVSAPAEPMPKAVVQPDRVPAAVESAFSACGLRKEHVTSRADTWLWRDPTDEPGLAVTLQRSDGNTVVRLSQALYGPAGPSRHYRCVKKRLVDSLSAEYGKEHVRVE